MIEIPLRTGTGLNNREHWRARGRRVKAERMAVAWALAGKEKPELPCLVHLTRIAPSNGLDDDNLAGALKSVRDQVAEWLGVDDKRKDVVRYITHQRRGPWGVTIDFASMGSFMTDVEGLRPLGPNDAIPELHLLTVRRADGSRARICCRACRQDTFEKRGDLYHCWNCAGDGDALAADGDGWKLVEASTSP